MPRRARRESATGFYHIVSRGLDRENIFGEKREKTRFLNLLKDNLKDCNIEIYAYYANIYGKSAGKICEIL